MFWAQQLLGLISEQDKAVTKSPAERSDVHIFIIQSLLHALKRISTSQTFTKFIVPFDYPLSDSTQPPRFPHFFRPAHQVTDHLLL